MQQVFLMPEMSLLRLSILFVLFWSLVAVQADPDDEIPDTASACPISQRYVLGGIGAVIDQSSRLGKEQKVAVELAVHDFNGSPDCGNVVLHIRDSYGGSVRAASAAIGVVKEKHAHAIVGGLTLPEAALIWELDEATKDVPIISVNPIATTPLLPTRPHSLVQMGTDISIQMQCMASIIGRFGWQKVIAIYESSNSYSAEPGVITYLSDSLRLVHTVAEHHVAFPRVVSLQEPERLIEKELIKLRSKNTKVFTILQSSLDFAVILFRKAKQLGMMEKGYVWIISDDIASLLDSVEVSVILDMQGVIGFRTSYVDNNESFKQFKFKFRSSYSTEYPEEEEHSSPSISALRAYDATLTIAKAMQDSEGKPDYTRLKSIISSSNFEGLSGKIHFKNGALSQRRVFRIVNVIGRSYREILSWSLRFGFLEDISGPHGTKSKTGSGLVGDLGSIYWPGGEQTIPKGSTLSGVQTPLRVGVSVRNGTSESLNVTYQNATSFTKFSIEVFEAAISQLPYDLPFTFVPYHGSYDEMVAEVSKKADRVLDAAVGDTEITEDHHRMANSSPPYIESGIDVVVTAKPAGKRDMFIAIKVFKKELWILISAMTMCTGIVIWFTEHVSGSPEFQGSFPGNIWSMVWFSATMLTLSPRESLSNNLSRLMLTQWLFVVFVVAACLTSNFTSMINEPRLQPPILDINHLLDTNAAVGCNGNSFILRYLIDALQFKAENIKKIDSIDDYTRASLDGHTWFSLDAIPSVPK